MNAVLDLIKSPSFPCTMAKTLAAKNRIEFKSYDLKSFNVHTLRNDLNTFRTQPDLTDDYYKSFVAEFSDSSGQVLSFSEFEERFWDMLSKLRSIELESGHYDQTVSSDPEHKKFGFSINGSSYFLILLHPDNPRMSRRSAKPALVFNLHVQFEQLRAEGLFDKFVKIIRGRDQKLQGDENPMMKNFGNSPEWLQYTGREMSEGSKCPFARFTKLVSQGVRPKSST